MTRDVNCDLVDFSPFQGVNKTGERSWKRKEAKGTSVNCVPVRCVERKQHIHTICINNGYITSFSAKIIKTLHHSLILTPLDFIHLNLSSSAVSCTHI